MAFQLEKRFTGYAITDLSRGVKFIGDLIFDFARNSREGFTFPDKNDLVTCRDWDKYDIAVGGFKINPSLRYCEVGPGLGGFLEYLTINLSPESPKPCAIDFTDFKVLKRILQFALTQDLRPTTDKKRIVTLIGRCDLLLSGKVGLININLEEVLQTHPELENSMDAVIDNYGPLANTRRWDILTVEKRLLKPGGKIYTNCPAEQLSGARSRLGTLRSEIPAL
jgi:hypothetical protein